MERSRCCAVRPARLLAVLLAAALLAGCTSSGSTSGSSADRAQAGEAAAGGKGGLPAPMSRPGEAGPAADAVAADRQAQARAAAAVDGAQVVRDVQVSWRVGDLAAAAARVRAIAAGVGAVITSESTDLGDGPGDPGGPTPATEDLPSSGTAGPGRSAPGGSAAGPLTPGRSYLVLRVPASRLDTALTRLSVIGRELSRTSSSEDVTAEVVDVQSRIATQQRSLERLRALMDKATGIGDLIQLEAELTRRQADLESLQATRAALADRVALATVTVSLVSPAVATSRSGFRAGVRGGWQALLASAGVVAHALGAALPFLVVIAVPVAGVAALWRRRRRPRAGASGSAG